MKKLFRRVFEEFGYTWDDCWVDNNDMHSIVTFMLDLNEDRNEIYIVISKEADKMGMTKVDKKLLELGYGIVADEEGDDEKEFLRYEYGTGGLKYFLSFFPRKNRVCIGLDVWQDDKMIRDNVAERLDPIVLVLVVEKIIELGMSFDNTDWEL